MSDPATTTPPPAKRNIVLEILPKIIFVFFVGVTLSMFPWMLREYWRIILYITGLVLFFGVIQPASRAVFKEHFFASLSTNKRTEFEDRLVSLFFNLSTGIPSYLVIIGLFPGHPDPHILSTSRTGLMDVFSVWSIAYIMYDYCNLWRVYGSQAITIQLHHLAEALIVVAYSSHDEAAAYIVGGGLMQLSSGLLHIQRIVAITGIKLPQSVGFVLRWSLTLCWLHGRLIAFPLLMWKAYTIFPISPLHVALIIAGVALTAMNTFWMYKIFRMKNLGF